jgi:tRNA threonylcarbamoyladenosine biosynthesis protein TsaB
MRVLAFDTCLGAVSAAVRWQQASGKWHACERYEERATGHAECLMPMIRDVMQEGGLSFADIDRIAVTLGPGSFTGVRIGVAAARALALATGRPVVGTTSLEAMAHVAKRSLAGSPDDELLGVAVDARRGMVYWQAFENGCKPVSPPVLCALADIPSLLGIRGIMIVGSGAAAIAETINRMGGNARAALPNLQPRAGSLAVLAAGLQPMNEVKPLYLRAPDVRPQDGKSLPRAAS